MNKINIENFNDLKSWPFKEAQQILKRNGGLANFKIPKKGHILLETGYGPSGLPHICLLYTSPSPRDVEESRMPSYA